MLKHLLIRNYALIRNLELNPSPSLNIITGETGAGKSIMLGALGLLRGERADTKALLEEDQKCLIEGTFDLSGYQLQGVFEQLEVEYEQLTVIRREISPGGKSRAFVNDTPVRLELLRQLADSLMDIHSQHDTLLLGMDDFQLEVVDAYLQRPDLLEACQEAFRAFRQADRHLQELVASQKELQREYDFNLHLLGELVDARLDGFEQEEMESELEKLQNAESIKTQLNTALELMSKADFSAQDALRGAMQAFASVASYSPVFEEFKTRTESLLIELKDVVFETEREEENLMYDPARIEVLQDRLDRLYTLQKKHRVETLAELVALRNSLQEKVNRVAFFDEEVETAREQQKATRERLLAAAAELTQARLTVLAPLQEEITALLVQLGMPNATFRISREDKAPEANGADLIRFLFSANKGISPQDLRSVASGGEFSRLMLSIKYLLARKVQLPTIVFDEIDTGISGEIAIKMGRMMLEMSRHHQVICISHLPQIAALGQTHYFVYKDHSAAKTESRVRLLSQEERVTEIAQMIGGASPSEVAFQSARELMQMK